MTPKVVLDSNVIVSGLGWSGAPASILDAALDGRLVLVTSPPLLAEDLVRAALPHHLPAASASARRTSR